MKRIYEQQLAHLMHNTVTVCFKLRKHIAIPTNLQKKVVFYNTINGTLHTKVRQVTQFAQFTH